MIFNETYKMYNGVEIPKLALGTWLIEDPDVEAAVKSALEIGYRHIDTAQAYGNERGVGQAVRDSGIPRDEIFITSKVAAEIKNYEEAAASIDASLEKLGLDYIDLMLIHCPQPWAEFNQPNRYPEENRQVWKALEEAYEAGKVRAIGVSNFQIGDIENIFSDCKIKPMANQICIHIANTPDYLINFCHENEIVVEAYSPIAHGGMLNNEVVGKMAEKYNVSIAQLCVKYDLQLGLVVLPKTTNPKHMESNAQLDFVISDEDMEVLKKM